MRNVNVNNTDLKLVQIFLSQSTASAPAVFEVSLTPYDSFHCTCPGYRSKEACIHINFVETRIAGNNGVYPLEISNKASQEELDKSSESNEEFRKFILKFGKIEVY
jgi:hypothetical protein